VRLRSGETLDLECRGDLGEANAGVLVFVDGMAQPPAYLAWREVDRIVFDLHR
jgi:hypothetical protein